MSTETNYYNELHDFTKLVAEMRAAQKAYFRNRDGNNLEKAKRLEKEVDNRIRELDGIVGEQTTMF